MKLSLPLALVVICGSTFAAGSWPKHFLGEGCGSSERQAREISRREARKTSSQLQVECEKEAGQYAVRFTNGYCQHDDGDIQCRVRCTTYGKASCQLR